MNIYCQGSNGGQVLTSDKPMINVLYGPSQIVCKLGGSTMSSAVSVKEGWEFRLDCSSDGNPSPSFSWALPGDGPTDTLFIRSINRTHTGRFRIIARSNLIPSEQQAVNLTKDIYVKVEVQYPPDPPSCRVGSTALSSNIVSAIRGNTITINCSCDSNPSSRYSWSVTGVSTPTSGQSFDLVVQKATTITLTMENSMQFTNGTTEQGRRDSPFDVRVLFPPVVKPLKNVTVLEKSQVSVACEVTAGVPNKTVFRWENISDMTSVATEQTLRIANISRAQGGYYRCNASNFMEPTGYDSTFGNSNNTVYIDVQYEAKVTNFTQSNVDNGQTFPVNETTHVKFYCRSQSNPFSKMVLSKQNKDLKTANNTHELEFEISRSTCEDDGIYQCTAQNIHNTKADIKSLTVFVRCSPRASTLAPTQQNVTTPTNVSAVLTLNFVAFPRPRVAEIVWENIFPDNDTRVTVRNGSDVDILLSEDRLQTNLSFRSVTPNNFGHYRVHVKNELGNYTTTFILKAQERPHSPFILQHLQKVSVDTIYIEWTPGFDGGLTQTFHVEYRDIGSSVWRKDDVIAGHFYHTIVGLNPKTMYKIRVFSTNDIGNSSASEVLTVATLKRPETGGSPVVLIAVLGAVACGVVLCVVIIIIVKRRKAGKRTDVDRLTNEHQLQSKANTDENEEDDDDEVINPLYGGGDDVQDHTNKVEAIYSQPQKKKAASVSSGVSDLYSVVNKKPKGKKGTGKALKQKKKAKPSEDVYENATNHREIHDRDTTLAGDIYENHEVPLTVKATKRNVNADGLLYADLELSNPPNGQQGFVIHGLDNMTEYAEVDLTKRGKPFPEKDGVDSKSTSK
ncbi:nephrin-like [Mya arenaria]|uniref:nephrin-like n=1 Tax=Mya arenaria TaxID=6604 RepID=UPI0022DEA6C5|nr:nephrin-like [Mya arenaria]